MTMPALGESVTEGTVTRWLKAEGDEVEVDEPLLEVSTDKVDTEIPSPVAGTLTKILVGEDETVPVGADLAVIGGSGAGAAPSAPPQEEPRRRQETAPAAEPALGPGLRPPGRRPAPPRAGGGRAPAGRGAAGDRGQPRGGAPAAAPQRPRPQPAAAPRRPRRRRGSADAAAYVTPLVRKLAAEHGVDLGSLKGTGVGGRIRKQDVLDAAEAAKAAALRAAAPAPPLPRRRQPRRRRHAGRRSRPSAARPRR